jgi:hypothetical protein
VRAGPTADPSPVECVPQPAEAKPAMKARASTPTAFANAEKSRIDLLNRQEGLFA